MLIKFSHILCLKTALTLAVGQEILFNPFKSRGSSLQLQKNLDDGPLLDNRRRQNEGLGVLNGVMVHPPKPRTLEDSKSFLLTSQLPHVSHRFEVVDRQPVVSFSTVIQPQEHIPTTFATQQTVVHEAIVPPPAHLPSLDEVSAPQAEDSFEVLSRQVVQQPALPVAQQTVVIQPEVQQPILQAVPQVQLDPTTR